MRVQRERDGWACPLEHVELALELRSEGGTHSHSMVPGGLEVMS